MTTDIESVRKVAMPTTPRSLAVSGDARPVYYPALDGLRAFSVLFVMYEHVTVLHSPLNHFHGWLGVDIFFVLSGFLITGLLAREERITGRIDMVAFYIRRAFRILPLYWCVLSIYVLMLLMPANYLKWAQMKVALPYFLTFNNEIPLLFMPDRVGTIFGLSWTLGIEEKFYLFWPFLCFVCLQQIRRRVQLGVILYAALIGLEVFSFKICRSYSGLLVGALLALICSSEIGKRLVAPITRMPSAIVLLFIAVGFALVDLNRYFVILFSWSVAFSVASLAFQRTWLSIVLSNPVLVWIGKRSYAMYLIQGFAMQALHRFFTTHTPLQEIEFALGSFILACLGASLLHIVLEKPAIGLGKALIQKRIGKNRIRKLPDPNASLMDRSPA